jgi:primary-amine oxidase
MTDTLSGQLSAPVLTGRHAAVPHPLDPLTPDEIRAASVVLTKDNELPPSARFVMIQLHEPPKPPGLVFDPEAPPERVAKVSYYDKAEHRLYEALVSLTASKVLSTKAVPGKFPSVLAEEFEGSEEAVRNDPRWQEAMRKRGVEDFSLAMIDPWPSGYTGPADDPATGPRLVRPLTFVRTAEGEHGYARPVEGLIATVNLDTMEVLDVADHGVVPLPPTAGNYEPRFMFDGEHWQNNRPAFEGPRTDVKPIEITQPDGPSFTVDGHAVAWQKWKLRIGFTPREGLVLHQLTYTDKGRDRPVVYRASLAEMVVPYGDKAPTHWNKNVFDMGEVGMGLMANSLTLGCDCVGHIHYFDGWVNSNDGEPVQIPNAVCMHEEDYGIAWKHTDFRTGVAEVRRLRRLVISTIATVGNYEYGFFWYLYNDGSIEYEIKLSGVLTTGALPDGELPRHGQLVAPNLYGPNHQHFFSIRLDMSVDGEKNSVYAIDSVADPGGTELNPYYNSWVAQPTLIETEGPSDADPYTARYWKVTNPSVKNELGGEVGYKLEPRNFVPTMVQEGSAIYDRARFVQHALWVTAFDPDELYAAGDYPYQNPSVEGLPVFVEDAAPVADSDLVLWYTVGAHHIVRPEDWPVMPVAHTGFHLKPVGFFDGNPALDLPADTKACHPAQGGHGVHEGHEGHEHHHHG